MTFLTFLDPIRDFDAIALFMYAEVETLCLTLRKTLATTDAGSSKLPAMRFGNP